MSPAAAETRTLSIYNIHTKETATIVFKRDGEFLSEGLKQVNHAMRDWRREEATEMDPELVDLIWEIHRELGSNEPVHLISGYRSRKTNNKLRRTRGGQAKNSRHILGKAADIHFPDVPVKRLRNSALVREVGGVGYYPTSSIPFVHVDTGRIRHWPRLPRQELAALFPDGKTQHVPRGGKPITLADSRAAIERLREKGLPVPHEQREERRRTLVADAGGHILAQRRRLEDLINSTGKTQAPYPAVVTAGAGLNSLPWLAQIGGITGSIPKDKMAGQPAPNRQARVQLASADPAQAIRNLPFRRAPGPATPQVPITQASVESAPDYDPEHPEELSYQPFSVMPLMGDKPLSHDTAVAALEQPVHDRAGYLLMEPGQKPALRMKPFTGVLKVASSWEFSGPAVRNLAAPAPRGRVMTASPARRGYGAMPVSGRASGFGFSSRLQ